MVTWTEKRVERLKLLHKEGFPATAIAKKLGPEFTKGMVAGKIHRVGLAAKPAKKPAHPKLDTAPLSRPTPAKPKFAGSASASVRIIVPPAAPRRPTPAATVGPVTGIRLYDLREGHCRWPVGNDRPAKFFCGAASVPSKSWCEHHCRMAYGHRPTHQNRERKRSPGQMLLQAVREHAKRHRIEPAHRSP
jgi:hypothetical protein